MPQLDPTPWFFILSSSWLIFILLTPTKISKYQHLNNPTTKTFKSLDKQWLWPWL